MPLAAGDYWELSRLLEENPELRADLRRLVLTQDLLDLPGIVRELAEAQRRTEERVGDLAEAQRRTEERVGRLEEAITGLAEAQRRTEERVGRLEEAMGGLAEAQRRTEERVGRLEEAMVRLEDAQRRTEEQMTRLIQAQVRTDQTLAHIDQILARTDQRLTSLENHVGTMRGQLLEWAYREKCPTYFGSILRRARPVNIQEFEDALEPTLSEQEVRDLYRADLLVRGVPRSPGAQEVTLVLEISRVADRGDAERALRRAGILHARGMAAIPAIAGEAVTEGAENFAAEHHVLILQDGRQLYWQDALAHWVGTP